MKTVELNAIKLEDTEFYAFVKAFCEEHNHPFENRHAIGHHHAVPFDSVDRFIALYLLEKQPEIIALDISTIKKSADAEKMFDEIKDEDFKAWFDKASWWAYDNYEREGISQNEALFYIIRESKQGKDHIIKDSYADGGWFGAS